MSAALALRAAVLSQLSQDEGLVAVLGQDRIYDEVPQTASAPYVVLAGIESREAGASMDEAQEHRLTLNIWSRQGGLSETLLAADRIVSSLDGKDMELAGHRLANFRWLSTDARRVSDGRHRFASLRFRALTEPDV